MGAPASEGPRWAPVDDETADLLSIIADSDPTVDEWPFFLSVLEKVAAEHDGFIDQNVTRPLFHGSIRPARVGAFFNRAARRGLIRPDGHTTTTNSASGNGGKPARSYRYLGT